MITVAVAGGFDPLHSGHIEHLEMARMLGDRLVVLTCTDDVLVGKKGYCFMPLADRIAVLRSLRFVDEVVIEIGGIESTLRRTRPNIFAKGGDRTTDNMPQSELDVCKEIGCTIVYGIGRTLSSSSELVRTVSTKLRKSNNCIDNSCE
jgi:D-beta-D-heptose 7-phosphate kinase/D-beta-D-heptose 1-phosphate adenosyltransferase